MTYFIPIAILQLNSSNFCLQNFCFRKEFHDRFNFVSSSQ